MEFIGRVLESSENCREAEELSTEMETVGQELYNYVGRVTPLERTNSDCFLCPEMLHARFKIPLKRLIIPSVGEEVGQLE